MTVFVIESSGHPMIYLHNDLHVDNAADAVVLLFSQSTLSTGWCFVHPVFFSKFYPVESYKFI